LSLRGDLDLSFLGGRFLLLFGDLEKLDLELDLNLELLLDLEDRDRDRDRDLDELEL